MLTAQWVETGTLDAWVWGGGVIHQRTYASGVRFINIYNVANNEQYYFASPLAAFVQSWL